MRFSGVLTCLGVVVALTAGCGQPEDEPPTEAPPSSSAAAPSSAQSGVLLKDDFEMDPFARWEPVTKGAWKWEETGGSHVFHQFQNVERTESVRAPFNRNVARDLVVGDFQFDVDLQSTARDYPNRSLCLFFGYQDPEHMYYVHFGQVASDTSNQIFIVNGKDRMPISTTTTPGTPWDDAWHHARIVRAVDSGAIKVYFDDLKTPVMTATDTTFSSGRIGIGSFDDTGRFDNVVVRGQRVAGVGN